MRPLLVLACAFASGCAGCGEAPAVDDTSCGELDLHRDADGDGFGSEEVVYRCAGPGFVEQPGDCDDGDAASHPGAEDAPCDGVDADCEIEDLAVVGDVFYATLEEAIAAAGPEEVVRICPGVYPVGVVHAGDLTIEAYDGDPFATVLMSDGTGSILDVTGGSLTVRDLWFMEGDAPQGGAIAVRGGDLVVEGARFTDLAAESGGALFAEDCGSVVLRDAYFEDVLSREAGAALWADGAGVVEVMGTSFAGGRSYGDGAGVMVSGGSVRIDGSSFVANEATGSGGALLLYRPEAATIVGSSFVANRAYGANDGGAVQYTGTAPLRVEDSSFRENVSGCGAALSLSGRDTVTVEVVGGEIVGNIGAAVANCSWGAADVLLDGVLVADNHGSAISVDENEGYPGSTVEITRSRLLRNDGACAVTLLRGADIVSVETDWGEGADDNVVGDLYMDGTEYTDLGAVESFACDDAGCAF
jgi:hypothetical protein